jgi:D-serine deaminase-like pyridoxal phosphate-dependent protein
MARRCLSRRPFESPKMRLPIETPALLVDLPAMERNLARMAGYFEKGPTRLRPHYKNHKCPELARRQLAAGAIGITCATLSEADALVRNGVGPVLIANEIAGEPKIRHFVELSRCAEVIVAVDNADMVDSLAAASRNGNASLNAVVDIDVGQGRCGVLPGEPALALARHAIEAGLRMRGLMGYEGRLQPGPERTLSVRAAMEKLVASKKLMESNGIPVEIATAGGTSTYSMYGDYPEVTDIQCGSYLLMDTDYPSWCSDFEPALSVLGTVISKTGNERIVADVGLKAISSERGLPRLKNADGAKLRKLNAEHAIIDLHEPSLPITVGDQIEIWAHYGDATINLHDRLYGIRNGAVEEMFRIEG